MLLQQDISLKVSVSSNLFSLRIKKRKEKIILTMRLFTQCVTTKHFPNTIHILQKQLPSIFSSKCFNEMNIPFSQEVKQTEIGHLFEHIILENLCKGKISLGFTEAIFSGITKWDWNKDEYGMFHIHLDIPQEDTFLFTSACEQSIFLLEKILMSSPVRSSISNQTDDSLIKSHLFARQD